MKIISLSTLNLTEKRNNRFILTMNDYLTPSLILTHNDMIGFEDHNELLYLFSMAVIYKFQCENMVNLFDNTQKFITAHYQKYTLQNNPWFKSTERKLLDSNKNTFYSSFKKTIMDDLESYNGELALSLVDQMKIEITKLNL